MLYNFSLINDTILRDINAENFADIALELFRYQYANNSIYRQFTDALHIRPGGVNDICRIPYLPVSFFKTHKVVSGEWQHRLAFATSGTTQEQQGMHYIKDAALYKASLMQGFEAIYGDPEQYAILALLPSYLERQNSSLVHMAQELMKESGHPDNGFYLNEWEALADKLQKLESEGQKVLLLGVTFALLDFAERYPMRLKNTIVMETGGMKGRREEWTRGQVHSYLKERWQLDCIHSEYGMTEMLSQGYAVCNGLFQPAATMRVLVRDINDPLTVAMQGSGCLNIIDLVNIHSCSFLATDDIGNVYADGSFEVLGRADNSALRGCSLMAV